MNRLLVKCLLFAAAGRLNENKTNKIVKALPHPVHSSGTTTSSGVRVSAINMPIKRYAGLDEYIKDLNSLVSDAAGAKSRLVVFPDIVGILPITAIAGFDLLFKQLMSVFSIYSSSSDDFTFVCESVQGFLAEVYHNTFSALAKKHNILIAAGGLYQTQRGVLSFRRFLFSETGDVAGVQDKIFLHPLERQAGVVPAVKITPAQSSIGSIALFSALELPHYEPFAAAASMGCAIAAVSAFPLPKRDVRLLAGCRSKEQRMCLAVSGMSGGMELGLNFDVPAGIFEPGETAKGRSGVVALAKPGETVTGLIDPLRVREQFDAYSSDRNPQFFENLLQ